jgi:hypothetical protein
MVNEPPRIAKLPHHHDHPVPWHVQWIDEMGLPTRPSMGIPDGTIDSTKFDRCLARGRCWICGELRNRQGTFILNATSLIERYANEPPSHADCAAWAAQTYKAHEGVLCLWSSARFLAERHEGRIMWRLIGDADSVEWWLDGRRATFTEALASVTAHHELLDRAARAEGWREARTLHFKHVRALKFLPEEEPMIYRGYKLERDIRNNWTIYLDKRVVAVEGNQDKAMAWIDGEIARLAEQEKA